MKTDNNDSRSVKLNLSDTREDEDFDSYSADCIIRMSLRQFNNHIEQLKRNIGNETSILNAKPRDKSNKICHGAINKEFLELKHILDASFKTYYVNRTSFKNISYHDWVFECDYHQYICIFKLYYKSALIVQFGVHNSKVVIEYFTNCYGEDFLDKATEIITQMISDYIE